MQLLPILLVATLLARENVDLADFDLSPGLTTAIACGPPLFILLLGWLIVSMCGRRLDRGRGAGAAILRADRTIMLMRLFTLLHFAAAVLAFGWLDVVQSWVGGDVILLDELIAITPPIVVVLATWWVYYPIEGRVREALLIRRLDLGRPIYPMPTRLRYTFVMARTHLLLIFVPIVLILGMSETVYQVIAANAPRDWPQWATELIVFAGAVVIFMLAPPLAALTLDVRTLPDGPLRDDLEGICARHRVKIRRLLLWNTNGMMINAAVMGLIGPLRYVLLTDALVETMERGQIQAVMAHEIGHVRRNHMPWLAISFLAAIAVIAMVIELPMRLLIEADPSWLRDWFQSIEVAATAIALLGALVLFGWVSRRFERQADTFAVQHLSMANGEDDEPPAPSVTADSADAPRPNADPEEAERKAAKPPAVKVTDRVTIGAVNSMVDALGAVARLNSIRPERRSWRHGSIAWRQQYLRSLIGLPIRSLPIDRVIMWLKRLAAVVLAAFIVYIVVEMKRTS